MRFAGGLSAVLLGTAIVIVQPVARALTPSEVGEIAKQITVRIDGANTGSRVIIEHQGNVYNVVTCWHVVQLKGNYTVQTPDGKKYTFNNSEVKRFSGVDLAVFQFTSNENYRVAEKGNSDQVALGTNISVAGYPQGTSDMDFRRGAISRLVTKPKDGYAFAINPQYALAYRNRGLFYSEKKDKQKAIENLQQAAKLYYSQNNNAAYQYVMNILKDLQR
ncbi:trypsin-like peptidase domain-containing protein [Nostoc sp.]|uniref:trypsin-like peptidase domain-containing protein n=1 Tax=Nostoc sp. TaxID=1180 RepID=UPI002FF6B5D7